MKTLRFILVLCAVTILSCSKDDEPTPLSQVSVGLGSKGTVVTAPSGLTSSSDPYAQQVVGYFELVNSLADFTASFKAAPGAQKASTKINPVNGRIASTTETYTWNEDGTEIAYQ